MSIEGQGHFFTIYFPGFVCFVLYLAKISGERLQDHWSSGLVEPQLFSSPEPKAHIVAQMRPQKSAPSELLWSLSVNK